MPDPVFFSGGSSGTWRVRRQGVLRGEGLPLVERLEKGPVPRPEAYWIIGGVTSNLRYTHASEKRVLDATPSVLGRPAATCAALIPITKSAAWWGMAQDERRAVIEDESRHISIGIDYLSAISRQLVHCRDQAGAVFDFLTWFEFAPADESRFDELLGKLRASAEWTFVEREVELRLDRAA